MRWPFGQWGASLVVTGHQHVYERLVIRESSSPSLNYIVNGLGGHPWLYDIDGPQCKPEPGSQVRYSNGHGLMVVAVNSKYMEACFYSIEGRGTLVDHFFVSPSERLFGE